MVDIGVLDDAWDVALNPDAVVDKVVVVRG